MSSPFARRDAAIVAPGLAAGTRDRGSGSVDGEDDREVCSGRDNVRTWRKETYGREAVGLFLTPCRHRRSKFFALRGALLDHLVSGRQQCFRDGEAEGLSGLE